MDRHHARAGSLGLWIVLKRHPLTTDTSVPGVGEGSYLDLAAGFLAFVIRAPALAFALVLGLLGLL